MTVGELRERLEKLPDDMWVFVRDCGDLADPSVDVVTDDGQEVLVIA